MKKTAYMFVQAENNSAWVGLVEAHDFENSGTAAKAVAHDVDIGFTPRDEVSIQVNSALSQHDALLAFSLPQTVEIWAVALFFCRLSLCFLDNESAGFKTNG